MADYAQNNEYVIDPDLLEEMHRLDVQGRLLTKAMGGVLPEHLDFASIHAVLDIGCGPADWALEVAQNYPTVQVAGIDKAPRMIEFAQARAFTNHLSNIHFYLGDITEAFPFPDHSFDLVNARLLRGFLATAAWPPLVQECWRVLRPGGVIRLSEDEVTISNSQAFDQLSILGYTTLFASGKAFSSSHSGVTLNMRRWLEIAGFRFLQERLTVVDISFHSDAYDSFAFTFKTAMQLVQPFLVRMNPETGSEAISRLIQQALQDMQEPWFSGRLYLITVMGEKGRVTGFEME